MSTPNPTPNRRVVGSSGPIVWKPRTNSEEQQFSQRTTVSFLRKFALYRKYPQQTIFVGAVLTFCIVWSGQIYNFFRTPPENINPLDTMWPGEKLKGKTYKQQFLEKQQRILDERNRMKAEAAEAKANLEAQKARVAAIKVEAVKA